MSLRYKGYVLLLDVKRMYYRNSCAYNGFSLIAAPPWLTAMFSISVAVLGVKLARFAGFCDKSDKLKLNAELKNIMFKTSKLFDVCRNYKIYSTKPQRNCHNRILRWH